MSQTVVPSTVEERQAAEAAAPAPKTLDALHTEHGDTVIAEAVVAKVAGVAAREVSGVFALGNAVRRAFSNLAERIPGAQTNVTGGVSVQKGERQTVIEISIIVEYGVSIVEVSDAIRDNVIRSVEHATGLDVLEVNINVTDVHLPQDDADESSSSTDLQ